MDDGLKSVKAGSLLPSLDQSGTSQIFQAFLSKVMNIFSTSTSEMET